MDARPRSGTAIRRTIRHALCRWTKRRLADSLLRCAMRSVALLSLLLIGFMSLAPAFAPGQDNTSAAPTDLALETPPTPKASSNPTRDAILEMTQEGYERIRSDIRDYSCILIKRERVDGRLGDYQYMQAKVRHAREINGREIPFSVYLKF